MSIIKLGILYLVHLSSLKEEIYRNNYWGILSYENVDNSKLNYNSIPIHATFSIDQCFIVQCSPNCTNDQKSQMSPLLILRETKKCAREHRFCVKSNQTWLFLLIGQYYDGRVHRSSLIEIDDRDHHDDRWSFSII